MTSLAEHLDKIDAALRLDAQNPDDSIAYPIIKELRDRHADSLERLIIQEKEKSEIDRESFLLLEALAGRTYSEKSTHDIVMIIITVRLQLRKISGLHRLRVTRS